MGLFLFLLMWGCGDNRMDAKKIKRIHPDRNTTSRYEGPTVDFTNLKTLNILHGKKPVQLFPELKLERN